LESPLWVCDLAENIGCAPALRFEVRQTGSTPIYPASKKPDPAMGMTYVKPGFVKA
jgi:hypothetical protein